LTTAFSSIQHPLQEKAVDPIRQFEEERLARIRSYEQDSSFKALSRDWIEASMGRQYVYNYSWLGRPIIQYPQDMVAIQELVWQVRPDLIIETGIAHGGSLILSASMLALLDMCDAIESGATMDPRSSKRKVLGIDIDIRSHNRAAIEAHPLASRIEMIQGSSIDRGVIDQAAAIASRHKKVLVCLDSNHTHDHVLAELAGYASLVTVGSYCVVFDTFVEDMPHKFFPDRPWDVGNNPKTAVKSFLQTHPEFAVDRDMEHKLMVTVAPDGFLKRVA
jgi:cephalosporin hydroxylase